MVEYVQDTKDLLQNLKFKGSWRTYQKRVLEELERHLSDKKLNVVAAPGAGKTTLGIEVMVRLQKPALILVPTITIKKQWKQRIIDGFLPDGFDENVISSDIKNISVINVSTYQALQTLYKNKEEKSKFLESLKANNIQTLILDEAHHLRTEWYVTLNNLCAELDNKDFTTVSLTGTPPYDVSREEWQNYSSLCGSVDAEISIPELVKNKNLCPHQDLIYFSNLSQEEEKTVFDFYKNRDEFFEFVNNESDLLYVIESSPFVNDIENNTELIYTNTGFTISIISYLLSIDELSIPAKTLIEFLGLMPMQIPVFDYYTAETLFNGIIGQFEKYFKNTIQIKSRLKELNLLNGKKVDFTGETDFKNIFARSVNKLDAINEITKFENENLKSDLREVILLDYIGKGDSKGLNISSVFDKLCDLNLNLGILTGTLIVIPKFAKEELYKILEANKISSEKVLTVDYNEKYLRVEIYGEMNIVSYITSLFEKGYINILIGTAALLGEGWDSPCVNTLIIASVVGSFMLSNQMRGRALRIDKNNPDKTSNIWHLVSLSYDCKKSVDFEIIKKRFNTFEGISYNENKIQNGTERLGLTDKAIEELDCNALNKKALKYAKERNSLKIKWQQVFNGSKITHKKMISQVYEIVQTQTPIVQTQEYHNFLQKMVGDLYKRHKITMSEKEQFDIAKCILKTLCEIGAITTPYEKIVIKRYKDKNGRLNITLLNCLNNERNIFTKSFCEVFEISDNTRYILKITNDKNESYLPVPEAIGIKKENVNIFKNYLQETISKKHTDSTPTLKEILGRGISVITVVTSLIITIRNTGDIVAAMFISGILYLVVVGILGLDANSSPLMRKLESVNAGLHTGYNIDTIYTKLVKNQQDVLKAKYNIYLQADISKNRIWI